MNKLPFIVPDYELNFRLAKILFILKHLSYTQRKKLHVTLDRIVMYDFLLKYPTLLNQVLINESKKEIVLDEAEKNSIAAKYPNYVFQSERDLMKKLLLLLSHYKLIDVHKDKEIYFVINKLGLDLVLNLSSPYTEKVEEICIALQQLRSLSFNQLLTKINHVIQGAE
ncbi:ABC-three component system middle component 4 [Bacillus rhizoplanae]|uniref:ABC-three component system middle component 4 n=1 Tax=Bacillus rhizoplanae TaxID=2880966 RepID=UPI003D1FF326